MAYKYGLEVIDQLSDGVWLGYSGAKHDGDHMVNIAGKMPQLWISVFAKTAITIDGDKYWYIELESWTSDDDNAARPPFSTGGTAENEAHYYLLHHSNADGAMAFAIGDLVTQMAVPVDLLAQFTTPHDWIQITTVTDKTDPGVDEEIDVILHAKL